MFFLPLAVFPLIMECSSSFKTKAVELHPNTDTQDEKSYLHSHSHPVQKCKCRECNTFAIVQIHVQMFQAMPFKR